jgi:peptide chain release factor 3
VQVFRPLRGNDYILGAVGVLQFDVTLDRLDDEYNVEAHLSGTPYAAARWVECDDSKQLDAFRSANQNQLFTDAEGDLAYLAASQFRLERMMDDWPGITFTSTKEHH